MNTLSIFFAYFVQFIKTRAVYKADFIISIIANTLAACSGLLYVFFLINGDSVTSIKGWRREEIFLRGATHRRNYFQQQQHKKNKKKRESGI